MAEASLSLHSESSPIDESNHQESSEYILAELCANAPDNEVRDCLRRYKTGLHTKQLKSALMKSNQPIIERTAEYLDCKVSRLKPDTAINIIVRIQNLLPEKCCICSQLYTLKFSDKPFLSCDHCLQEVHKECFIKLLGVDSNSEVPDINPLQIPGLHYLCKPCEELCEITKGPSSDPARTADELQQTQEQPMQHHEIEDSLQQAEHLLLTADVSHQRHIQLQTIHQPPSVDNTTSQAANLQEPDTTTSSQKPTNSEPLESAIVTSNQPPYADPQVQQQGHGTNAPHIYPKLSTGTTTGNQSLPKAQTKSKKICYFYKQNQCKYGLKGTGCPFTHPERCKKLLAHGTDKVKGCNFGRKKCKSFHPKMCPSSITKSKCYDDKCTFLHVKGTKFRRKDANSSQPSKQKPIEDHLDNKNTGTKSDNAVVPTECENQSFLQMVRLLTQEVKELKEAMDTKITAALSQLQLQQTPPQQVVQQQPHAPPLIHQPLPYQFQPLPSMMPQWMPHQFNQQPQVVANL